MNAIKLSVLAEKFEKDLNAKLNNQEIKFKIWSGAGEYQAFRREDNTVTWFINGNLRRATSANDANDLVMGVNGLTLDFIVPIQRPRTNANQTEKELAKMKDGQYPFVEYITNAINGYFEKAQTFTITDDNIPYAVAFQAGVSTTGTVDLVPVLGNCIEINVYIEVYYIQYGVNSKRTKLTVDGQVIPYSALRWGRSPMSERDVYIGSLVSKSVITSTAFAIDIDLPALDDNHDIAAINTFLERGKPNVGHFVTLDLDGTESYYYMTVNSAQKSAKGVSIVGTSVSFMEIADGYFSLSENQQMGRFKVPNSQIKRLSATIYLDAAPSEDKFIAYVGGVCNKFLRAFSLEVTPGMVRYNKADKAYYIYAVFPSAATVENPMTDGQPIEYNKV